MTHRAPASRTLQVDALARVEGEGAMYIEVLDGEVVDVALRIYEPPRFFEAFLRGRSYTEPPDITARVCGICPVAYQMSACLAIEDVCGVVVDGPLRDLRRLLYCGEWIESHTLHIYLLHLPDFYGYEGAIELAADRRDVVQAGLALKKAGNDLVAAIGGRPVHPVNVRVGGFYRVPTRRELADQRAALEVARDLAIDAVRLVGALDVPDHHHAQPYVALHRDDEYAVLGGLVRIDDGSGSRRDVPVPDVPAHLIETQAPHSTALHAHLASGDHYLVGPLARFSLGFDQLRPMARELAAEVGIGPGERNPFRSIVVRALEVLHAVDEALAIIDGYEEPDAPAVPVQPRAGVGHGATEAPRGLLYHRYELAADGTITDAVLMPPTSQNQPSVEHDLFHLVEDNLGLPDEELRALCEQAIRNYDPCISCATHFLDLVVDDRCSDGARRRRVVAGSGGTGRSDDGHRGGAR
jgi:coenzyme F420-reducing hydrogenase alpha subunit